MKSAGLRRRLFSKKAASQSWHRDCVIDGQLPQRHPCETYVLCKPATHNTFASASAPVLPHGPPLLTFRIRGRVLWTLLAVLARAGRHKSAPGS